MIQGCRIPSAKNFNPLAVQDDYSCQYMLKNQGNCHWFQDIVPPANNSFTLSYATKMGSWVFFHDYIPDAYLHTRDKLFSVKDSNLYLNDEGAPGQYYSIQKSSFFIDVVFHTDFEMLLETVNWMTEFLQSDTDQPFQTLSHISIWSADKHSGRIPLTQVAGSDWAQTIRQTKGEWILDDFRNILVSKGTKFLHDIFLDYSLDLAQADPTQPFYQLELLTGKWFCIRFEFDNQAAGQLVLHDTTIQATHSDR